MGFSGGGGGGGGGAVNSVFGRIGAILAANGDYTPAQVGALPATRDLSAIAVANPTAAAVPMNAKKITGLANGVAATDAATVGQAGGGAVSSVFSRTGAVVAANGDYTAAQVGARPAADDLSAIAVANPTAAAVPMNAKKITGLANGVAAADAATVGQLPAASPPAIAFGTAAARPAAAAGNANTAYFATDTNEVTFSDGATWRSIARTSAASWGFNASFGPALVFDAPGASQIQVRDASGSQVALLDETASVFQGLAVKSGANRKIGTATLVGGTVTVANTSITANSILLITDQSGGSANLGTLSENKGARVAGTSFTVVSTNVLDTSTFGYLIVEPA